MGVAAMGSTRQHLEEWQRAGVIDAAAAERILAFEDAQEVGEREQRPGFLEALVYLGIAIAGVGVIVLAASNWGHLGSWARVLVPGIPAVLALLAGQVMRKQPQPGIRRGGSAAWAASVALIAGAAAILMNEAGGRDEDIALFTALCAVGAAFVLWLFSPKLLQVTAGAGAALLLSIAISAETARGNEDIAQLAGGGTMLLLGFAATIAAEAGWIFPRSVCRFFAGLALAFGGFIASIGDPGTVLPEFIPIVAGAALIVIGIEIGYFPHIFFGVAAIFIGTIELVLRHVGDPTAAALALMVLGAALIVTVLLLAKTRPWERGGGDAPGVGAASPIP